MHNEFMDLRRLDLNLLVVFDAVLSERSVSRAADRLALTQPAVSHALTRLRQACGDQIVVRRGHAMVPTPKAVALQQEVRAILVRAQRVFAMSSAFDPARSRRHYQIGCSDHAAVAILEPVLGRILAQAPFVRIQLTHVGRTHAADMIRSGALDLALGVLNSADDAIAVKTLREVPYVCVARAGHPAFKRRLTLDRYLAAEHLQVLVQPGSFGVIDQTLSRLGQERNIRLVAAHFEAALRLLPSTDLILTVPKDLVARQEARWSLQAVPFALEPFRHQIAMGRSFADDPGTSWLIDMLSA
jgi:DNA-binding transcriptional LysR family regulator